MPQTPSTLEVEEKEEISEEPPAVRARAAFKAAREAGDQRTDEQVFLDELLGPGWDRKKKGSVYLSTLCGQSVGRPINLG